MSKQKKKKWLRLIFLHRYIGISIASFVILLSITGILLNHTEEFKLHQKNISSPWLMSLYGIKTPELKRAYPINIPLSNKKNWVVEFGESIYLNDKKLDCKPPLTGTSQTEDLFIISNQTQVCLFTQGAELVDYLSPSSEAANVLIKRLGVTSDKKTVLETTQGLFKINPEYTAISKILIDYTTIKWQATSPPPTEISNALKAQYNGEGLPLERIILDLHSGRIIGILGVYFMDLVALLLIFLAVSGIITWAARNNKKRKKKNV